LIVRPSEKINDVKAVGDVDVVAWPMNRFYNQGDAFGADVNWNDPELKVCEKLDGTMIVLYWDALQQRWCAGTRAVSEADVVFNSGHIVANQMTFSDLFKRAIMKTCSEFQTWDQLMLTFDKNITYVFELTSPFNRVVVKYDEERVHLIAARNILTGCELDVYQDDIGLQWIPRAKTWKLNSPSAVDAFVNQANPANLEGAVVCDSTFRRLKVKNKAWVLSSHAKDMLLTSKRSALVSIILETIDDVLPLLDKETESGFIKMKDSLKLYLRKVDTNFQSFKQIAGNDRKTFAHQVLASDDWVTIYFSLWDKKGENAWDWLRKQANAEKLTPVMLDCIISKIA